MARWNPVDITLPTADTAISWRNAAILSTRKTARLVNDREHDRVTGIARSRCEFFPGGAVIVQGTSPRSWAVRSGAGRLERISDVSFAALEPPRDAPGGG